MRHRAGSIGIVLLLACLPASCGDEKSATPTPIEEDTIERCSNGTDDDDDGLVDCLDPQCEVFCGDSDTDSDTGSSTHTGEKEDPCDPIAGTGCDAPDECKVYWSEFDPPEPEVNCGPEGASVQGDVCERSGDCEGRLTCWQSCRPPCHLTSDCSGGGAGIYDASGCVVVRDGWGYCTLPCDPFAPDSCPVGTSCMLIIDGDLPTTDCVADLGAGVAGDDCSLPLQCAPGTACDNAVGGFTCEALCDADDDCGGGTCRLLVGGLIGTCR